MEEDARYYIERANEHARLGQIGSAVDAYQLALRFEQGSLRALLGLTQ